jgi:UDP-N-acetylmuramate dehydrogenase
MRSAILAIRARKFPGDGSIGTAGSFFKNPVVTDEEANAFLKRFPGAPNFPQDDDRVKLSAAWIIDHVLNLRGVRERNVGTWPSQALVLVNYGGASGTEMKDFARMIIERAKKETGITLAPEVIFVGDE